MALIDVDLNAIPEDEIHPEAMLLVEVAKSTLKDNAKGDGKHVLWQLHPVESSNKRPVFLRTSLKPEAQFVLRDFLKACGFKWNSDGRFNSEDVLGCRLWVMVKQGTYNDEPSNEVTRPFRPAA